LAFVLGGTDMMVGNSAAWASIVDTMRAAGEGGSAFQDYSVLMFWEKVGLTGCKFVGLVFAASRTFLDLPVWTARRQPILYQIMILLMNITVYTGSV
jgi:hypothetical protein